MNDNLARLSRRAAADPRFLAFALAEYAAAERLDEAGLAAALGIPTDRLPHIRLCPTPRSDPDGIRADVDRIVGRFGADRDTVTAIVRHGQAVAAMRAAMNPDETAALLAARDRRAE